MATKTQRFGIRRTDGARSSEWVVMWKPSAGDVYVATRTLGGTLKASFHTSGRCHVRAPDTTGWQGDGTPPQFLDAWEIDPDSNYTFPFSIVVPCKELRAGPWPKYRDKGTIWLTAPPDKGVEIGFFFVRALGDLTQNLRAAGWAQTIIDASLPDGRRLLVVAGTATVPKEKEAELDALRQAAKAAIANVSIPPANPRLLLLAGPNEQGVRKFVEAAAHGEV